jgi:Chaperone of endosialidase
MNPSIQIKTANVSLLATLMFACFGLLPKAQAVVPAPDGGYAGANTAEGTDALFSLTSGFANTATGYQTLFTTISGQYNTATGYQALYSTGNAFANTATGVQALYTNTTGGDNTATGFTSLYFNTTGIRNTADGSGALTQNTKGNQNTAAGEFALYFNTTGNNNTANGAFALAGDFNGTTPNTGSNNMASGFQALFSNTTGANNSATGANALFNNRIGSFNTANGGNALSNNTSGSSNIALGINAGRMLTTGSNNIDIGNVGVAGESNKIRIGTKTTHTDTFIAGIFGAPVINGTQVFINPNGRLGTMLSSDRFKEAIKPMNKASEAILALQPVTFRYKPGLDPDGIPQFGLIAEQVEKVNPDLVVRDAEGKVYTVRYDAVNAMLLNEFLKEHRKVEKLEATVAHQQKQIEALGAGLQRVSEQLQLRKQAPQLVVNNQ